MTENTFLTNALHENGHTFAPQTIDKLSQYLGLMQQWNKVFNLTSITDFNEMVYLHILDSLTVLPYLMGKRIIDVGTGAGLPGIPLALTNPEKQFYLLDSNSKKTRFLQQVVLELGLKNVNVIHSRSEDFQPEHCFDTIITRAFASIKTMLTLTQHLLCPDGQFLAMKGVYPESEMSEIPSTYQLLGVPRLTLKNYPVERHLVCLKKSS